jgi:CBS domain-containing protein
MAANRVRRLVVLDETGRFTGVASLADLALATSGIVEDVLRKISGPPEELTQGIYTGGPAAVDHQPAESDAAALVKDELAAIETYKQVLQTVHSGRAADELRRIENEHEEAAKALKERFVKMGIEAPAAPDGQGAWLEAQEESAELADAKRSIALLKEAEEREIEDYERTLRDESLDSGLRHLIASRLLPRTRAHVPQLARFLGEGPVA